MAPPTADRTHSLQPYPNLSAAARILGVDPSTLSRRRDLQSELRGARDRVVPAAEVLRLATVFRKRSLNDVAQGLLEHARRHSPDDADSVEEEIERFFEARSAQPAFSRDEFLAAAARLLPPELYKQVADCISEGSGEGPSFILGYPQPPD